MTLDEQMPMTCPECHMKHEVRDIDFTPFVCKSCGMRLRVPLTWQLRRWWISLGTALIVLYMIHLSYWLLLLLSIPFAVVISGILSVLSLFFDPPMLERHLPPGGLGL